MKILQIGANDGNDHVYECISGNSSFVDLAILVEPIPYCIPLLKERYSDFGQVFIENVAISTKNDGAPINFYYEEGSNYQVSSLDKDHLLKHGCGEHKIKCIEIPSTTVNSLLKKYNTKELNFLFVDAEGHDDAIIRSINFSEVKIHNIYFECVHTDGPKNRGEKYEELVKYLYDIGYCVTRDGDLNSMARLRS